MVWVGGREGGALVRGAVLLGAVLGCGSSSLGLRGGGNAPSRAQTRQGKVLPRIVAIGGTTNGEQPLKSVESLAWHMPLVAPKNKRDAQSVVREWREEKESLIDARDSPAAVYAFGRVYVLGGYNGTKELSSVEWSDCPVQTANKRGPTPWAEAPSMKKRRCSPGAAVLGKRIFAVGGYNGTHDLRNAEFLEVGEQGKWAPEGWAWGPTMNYRRSGLSVVSLKGKLYGFGGFDGSGLLSSVEEMDGDRWTRFPSMPMGSRGGTAAVALRGRIFVIGGANEHDRLNRVESVDPREGRWTAEPGMHVPRAGLGATVWEDRLQICAAGGYNGETALKSAEFYDLRMRGSWLFEPDMVAQRWGMALLSV